MNDTKRIYKLETSVLASDQAPANCSKYVYIYSAFTFPVIALSQASILFFYRRLFFPSHMRYTTIVLLGIVAAWLIAAMVIEIGYPGHTIDFYFPGSSTVTFNVTYLSFWLAMNIIETLIEIVILILPIRELQRLQLSRRKKHLLTLIFSLGGFVVITGIIRMSIIYHPNEPDFDLTQGDIWLNVHIGTVIISACLPTYRPLISRSSQLLSGLYSNQGSHNQGTYNSDDTRTLRDKEKMRSSRSRYLTDEISMDQNLGQNGSFADARRSESNDTTRREWQDDGAIRAGEAIGVKKTIEVV